MPNTLAFKDRFKRIQETVIESDTSDSVAFASLPDNIPTKLITEWTGKQFTKLLSCVMTGADLMFPEMADEIIWQLIKVVHLPTTTDESGCINYLPNNPFTTFEPQNPYSEPDLVPDGYLVSPFHLNSDFLYPEIFGFLATDVMVATDAIPFTGDWEDLISFNFPTMKLRVRGEGQIEFDFLSIQLGGYAIIKVGSPPNIIDLIDGIFETGVKIVDLQADVESLPIESDLIVEDEQPINSVELVDVYVTFVPKISASLDFFGHGGGIRKIGLCGLESEGVMSCEGLEDCLGESVIINEIVTNVTNVTTEVTNLNQAVDDCGCGGNVSPKPDDYDYSEAVGETEHSKICNAAWYIANKVLILATSTVDAAFSESTLEEILLAALGAGGLFSELYMALFGLIQEVLYPELASDIGTVENLEIIQEALFCNSLDRSAARADIEASSMSGVIKDVVLAAFDAVTDAQMNTWAFIGGETGNNDCSEMCGTRIVVWDFAGTYVPLGDEDAIYSGNTWEVVDGEFIGGVGYRGINDTWYITHPLPPDCKVVSMVHNCNKNELCAAVRINTTWRGTSGEEEPEQSPVATVVSDTPLDQNWTVFDAELDHMTIGHDHFVCDGFGSETHWLRMVVRGSLPSA